MNNKMQFPLKRFWVSSPYLKPNRGIQIGTLDKKLPQVVAPAAGEVVEIIKRNRGNEVWVRCTNEERYVYISMYPIAEEVKGNILRNQTVGTACSHHITIRVIDSNELTDSPSSLKNYVNPLNYLYLYSHQESRGNIPYCRPKIYYKKGEN